MGPEDGLVDESAPGLPTPVPKNDTEVVGDAGNGAAVGIAEGITNLVVRDLFRAAMPDVSEFVPQTKALTVPETVKARRGGFFFEVEEPPGHLGVYPFTLEDAFMDHHFHYQDFRSFWG